MAETQTRRSVSLEQKLHQLADARAKGTGRTLAHYVSDLIRADLKAAGIEVPPSHHQKAAGAAVAAPEQVDPPEEPAVNRPRPPLAPAIARAAAKAPDADPKLVQALEFTRRKLEEQKQTKLVEQPPSANNCWWCGDKFKSGELPSEYDGNKVHGKCKRELNRTGPPRE